jgi:hypothetical protein
VADRYLFIISRRVPLTYTTMRDTCEGQTDIEIILDRRHAQRRRLAVPARADRRVHDRRSLQIDALLKQLGWVFVKQQTEGG